MKKSLFSLILIVTVVLFMTSCDNSDIITDSDGSYLETHIPIFPEMVLVPHGTFLMGYGNGPSGPAHQVTLTHDFEIGKYEITNNEYCNMLNYALAMNYLSGNYENNMTVENAEGDSEELLDLDGDYENVKCQITYNGSQFVVESGKENRPVVYVTWYGAAFYCNVLSEQAGLTKLFDLSDWTCQIYGSPGYRLPTEAEWEYAARYDDGRAFPWGSEEKDSSYANYYSSVGHATDVGSFPNGKSKLGLYDMAGNVSEWVYDWYGRYTDEPQEDPVNDSSGTYRQRRGGGWHPYTNNYLFCVYHTDTNYPFVSYADLGFRVVKIE